MPKKIEPINDERKNPPWKDRLIISKINELIKQSRDLSERVEEKLKKLDETILAVLMNEEEVRQLKKRMERLENPDWCPKHNWPATMCDCKIIRVQQKPKTEEKPCLCGQDNNPHGPRMDIVCPKHDGDVAVKEEKPWPLNKKDEYYCINEILEVETAHWGYADYFTKVEASGNCFRTHKAAETAAAKIRELLLSLKKDV